MKLGSTLLVGVGLALTYWAWAAFIFLGAGFLGAALNCEGGEGCRSGFPSWFQPWTWGDYDVFPETLYVALGGLAAATGFVMLIWSRRPLAAAGALVASLVLMSYPFFGGLTTSRRLIFTLGPLLALAALASIVAQSAQRTASPRQASTRRWQADE